MLGQTRGNSFPIFGQTDQLATLPESTLVLEFVDFPFWQNLQELGNLFQTCDWKDARSTLHAKRAFGAYGTCTLTEASPCTRLSESLCRHVGYNGTFDNIKLVGLKLEPS